MKKRSFLTAIIFFILFILVGCSSSSSSTTEKDVPQNVHKDFLYFIAQNKVTFETDNEHVGQLYLKQFGKEEVDKIAENVLENQFIYEKELNKVYYVTNDQALYEYEIGKDKEKLANEVNYFYLGNESAPVVYTSIDSDLYIIKQNGEKEKIGSYVQQVEIIDDDVYYVNENGHFMVYNLEDRTEKELAANVEEFKFLNKELDIAYVSDDGFLYFRDAKNEENIRISSDSIYYVDTVYYNGKELFYISDNDDLYGTSIAKETSTRKIASNVLTFDYDQDELYYLNDDDALFRIGLKDEEATRLASDVLRYEIVGNNIFYLSNDYNVYQVKDESNERMASSVQQFDVSKDGDIVYVNEENAIFVNDKKIVDEFKLYTFVNGNLVYSTKDNKIVMLENLKEEHVIDEDASKYDFAYYYGELVYKNKLHFSDIAGIWVSEEEEKEIIEFLEDGTLKYRFPSESSIKLKANEDSAPRAIYAISDESDGYLDIRKVSEEKLLISVYGGDFVEYTKTNEEEINKQIAKAKQEKDHEEITYLMNGYLDYFPDAVNYGSFYYIEDYIAKGSKLYNEQEKFVVDAYDKGIYEDILDYEIKNIQQIDDDTYAVTTSETFEIWVDGDSKVNTYENKYTVKRINGELLLTDIEVNIK